MRDPMNWAVRVFTAFGIPVKVHLFFIVISLGLFLRQVAFTKNNPIWWVDVLAFTVLLPFVIVLLHEFGHCFGGRSVGGEATQILMWPLGGLAFVEVPHTPRANFITVAAGPAVNVAICAACTFALAAVGFLPNLNPLANPYTSEVKNFVDHRVYTSEYGLKIYAPGTAELIPQLSVLEALIKGQDGLRERSVYSPESADKMAVAYGGERAVAPPWVVWVNRAFWLSWILLLFNLLPAYPLDGGQLLQSIIWARADYRRGVVVAAYSGFVVSVLFLVLSIAWDESLFMGLALFMLYMSSMKLFQLETDEGPFGYDFSAGYTSLEKDDEPAPPVKQPGPFARWWQARKARKTQRAAEQRAQDEERKEQLLEKIQGSGLASLTAEERRFLEQFSSKYRRH